MKSTPSVAERAIQGLVKHGGRIIEGPGRRFVRLDDKSLLDGAARRTGLSDPGDDAFREPLRRLLQSLESEAQLNFFGRIAARENITGMLCSRFELQRDRGENPGIAAESIRRPLFIAGLPRSGSTLLHGLLAQDPANRVPQNWELLCPSPPPERSTYDTDRRIGVVERQIRWFQRLAPEFRKIHAVGARLPEECVVILSHSLLSYQFSSTFYVPSYQAWMEEQDHRPSYELHRRFLQHLQWRCPAERWVLKAPPHLPQLHALFAVYPDAGVVLTHRDPLEVVASVSSLHSVLRKTFSDSVDPTRVGPEVSGMLAGDIRKGLQAIDQGCAPAERFLDVRYADLLRDPLAAVRKIYTHFDMPLSPSAESRMRSYLAENPQHQEGTHQYSLEEFGLDPVRERERYAVYRERFGV